MAKRGRPRSPRAASAKIVWIILRLYPGEDDDLIPFFDSVPRGLRAVMVKQALRSGAHCLENQEDDVSEDVLGILDTFVD